jgi:hypothetical protein
MLSCRPICGLSFFDLWIYVTYPSVTRRCLTIYSMTRGCLFIGAKTLVLPSTVVKNRSFDFSYGYIPDKISPLGFLPS